MNNTENSIINNCDGMAVTNVKLKNVRNYTDLDIRVSKGMNVFYGENAQGKTNFLESICFCAVGRSPRTSSDKDIIQFGEEAAHIRVDVEKTFDSGGTEKIRRDKIDVHIKRDAPKGMAINGLPAKKLSELFDVLLTVVFTPEDLSLVKAGPAERRRFVDMELCRISPVYYQELQQYHRVLKQRNILLKDILKNRELKQTIFVWDEQLAVHGSKIIKQRRDFIKQLSELSARLYAGIIEKNYGEKEFLEIIYKPNVSESEFFSKLTKNIDRDIMLGSTQTGAHKDEILFFIGGADVRYYGSQGQKRTASLCAKLVEIDLIREEKRMNPVLLLDDVFSELDEKRQQKLSEKITGAQTILTCTGAEEVVNRLLNKEIGKDNGNIAKYKVEKGSISLN